MDSKIITLSPSDFAITQKEKDIINAYRANTGIMQEAVCKLLCIDENESTNYIEVRYPTLSKLYLDLIQSDEWCRHPLIAYNEKQTNKLLEDGTALIQQGDYLSGESKILSASTDYEMTGFIMGYTYAMQTLKDTEKSNNNIAALS